MPAHAVDPISEERDRAGGIHCFHSKAVSKPFGPRRCHSQRKQKWYMLYYCFNFFFTIHDFDKDKLKKVGLLFISPSVEIRKNHRLLLYLSPALISKIVFLRGNHL